MPGYGMPGYAGGYGVPPMPGYDPNLGPGYGSGSGPFAPGSAVPTAAAASAPAHQGDGEAPLEDYIEQLERERILKALEAHRYNKTKTADALGITFRALRYRLKKLGIE